MFILTVSFLNSCDLAKDVKPTGTAVQDMAGDWFILQNNLTDGINGTAWKRVVTYNTSANDNDTLWLNTRSALLSGTNFVAKVPVTISQLTYNATSDLKTTTTATVSILEGKVLKGVATTSGGNKSDSIFIKYSISNKPGKEYSLSGYKRTGFLEDEH